MSLDSNVSNASGIPRLKGRENYAVWKLVINTVIEAEASNTSGKKSAYLEARTKQLIVTSVSEKILLSISQCENSESMFEKIEKLYGNRESDLDELHTQFQNFTYKNDTSAQENITRLENIRSKITSLGDTISESAFRSRLLNSLPKRFNGLRSACNVSKRLTNDDLIIAIITEDCQLTEEFKKRESVTSRGGNKLKIEGVCFICSKPGHKAKDCRSNIKNNVGANGKNSSNSSSATSSWSCFYCKEKGHGIAQCPKLKDMKCNNCQQNGHISKYCKKSSSKGSSDLGSASGSNSNIVASCMGLTSTLQSSTSASALNSSISIDKNSWVLDCACTQHICNDKSILRNLENTNAKILAANSAKVDVNLIGVVDALCNGQKLCFNDVLFNPNSPANLVSLIMLFKRGWSINQFHINKVVLTKDCFRIEATRDENDLWILPIKAIQSSSSELLNFNNTNKSKLSDNFACISVSDWHRCFAHQNIQYTKEHLNRLGIVYEKSNFHKCVSCSKGKICRSTYHPSSSVAKTVAELTHVDLLTSPVLSIGGSKYALVFKDDFSCYRTVYFLKTKDNTVSLFEDYFNRIETQTGNKPKRIRSDNGKEEINADIDELCSIRGIIHELTCPFTPEQNGRAEREMRVLSEAVTTILIDSNLEKKFWAEAMAYAAFTLNRVGKSTINGKTPYEVFYSRDPFDVRFLRPFGCKVIIQIPKEKRKKFDPRGESGIFLGYQPHTKGYKVILDSDNTIRVSCNVQFLDFKQDNTAEMNESLRDFNDSDYEITEIEYDWDSNGDNDLEMVVGLLGFCVPETFKEISDLEPNEKRIWLEAVSRELNSMEKHQVWEAVPYTNQKVIDTQWIFRVKNAEEAKARLVAKGFQSTNYSKTYAPVANITSIRVFLAIAVQRRMKILQADVETAFLNSELKEEIYIRPPDGLDVNKGTVLRLKKALYGLKQAPASWYSTIDSILTNNGFRRCTVELCLYIFSSDLFIIIYVDDFLIAAINQELIDFVLNLLKDSLEIKIFEKPEKFIGLSLNIKEDTIEIDQTDYIKKCVKRFGLGDSKTVTTPMETKLDLSKTNSNSSLCILKFQKLLGIINYIMERTRPDINFSTNVLSRKVKVANEELYKYLLRILKYLKGNANMKLIYRTSEKCEAITAYCDASWASIEGRSTTGYLIKVFDNLVCFKSRKQTLVSLSTAEAEYISMSECAIDVTWIRNILKEVGLEIGPITIYCDNQAAIKIGETQGNYNRTRHINIKYQHIKDLVSKNIIQLKYIESSHNLADFLTKCVDSTKIRSAMAKLGFKSV